MRMLIITQNYSNFSFELSTQKPKFAPILKNRIIFTGASGIKHQVF